MFPVLSFEVQVIKNREWLNSKSTLITQVTCIFPFPKVPCPPLFASCILSKNRGEKFGVTEQGFCSFFLLFLTSFLGLRPVPQKKVLNLNSSVDTPVPPLLIPAYTAAPPRKSHHGYEIPDLV